MSYKGLFTFIFVAVSLTESVAQAFYAVRRDHDLIASFGLGPSTYFGEMVNPGDNIDTRPSFSAGVQLYPAPNFIGNRISVRSELSYLRFAGNDATADDDRVIRNLSFFSNNVELNAVGLLHLLKQDKKFYKRYLFNIYGMTGIGLLFTNPKTEYQGEKVALKPLETEGIRYSRFQFVVPYGLGLKIRKGNLYNICIEAAWRKTFTDYIDDASSTRYPDPAILKSDLSRALSDRRRERDPDYPVAPGKGKRGHPENKDSYMTIQVKLEYFLPIDLFTDDGRLMWVRQNKPRRR